ncbi:MAG TPA: hypothetical protein VGH89_08730 [Pseudonocardia sp.]
MNPRASSLAGLLLITLVGCSGPTPPAQSPTPAPGSSAPSASDNATDCASGTCQLRITGPTTIPLDARFDIPRLRAVPGSDGSVTVTAALGHQHGGGVSNSGGSCSLEMTSGSPPEPGHLRATCDPGARLDLGTITIDLSSDAPGTAVLKIAPSS